MGRSIWGRAVEVAGIAPMLVGGVAGIVWSVAQGEHWEKGGEKATDAIGNAIEQFADFVDSHEAEINATVKSVAISVVREYALRQWRGSSSGTNFLR